MQDAADELALEMMRKYNKEKAIVLTLFKCTDGIVDYLKKYTKLLKKVFYRYKVGSRGLLGKENARALQKSILRRFVLLKPILISIMMLQ
jgi:proline dehydrogenase